jgi:3-phenylpropionate/trans-cinnamate dioxygenase ferredoxin reductase component
MAGVVIAGAGQAGFQVAATLRRAGWEGPVTLIGEEPVAPYQRPPLSKDWLAGEDGPERVHFRPAGFYDTQGVEVVSGDRVEAVDRPGRRVRLASGRELGYEHLVLALGARPRALRVPGADLDGVLSLRTVADAGALRSGLARARNVVVVGGGFIGLEVAAAARARGARVTVVEALDRVMARVVSPEISAFYTARHEAAGITVLLGSGVVALEGADGRVRGVELADGRRLPADLVLVGIGIVPVTDLAEAAGLPVDDGIVVDEHLRTSDPAIWAVGDCARYPSRHAGGPVRLESVQNATDHGRAVAAAIAGTPEPYAAVPWFWSDQLGTKLQIAGLVAGRDGAEVRGDGDAFSVVSYRDGDVVAVESVNQMREHMEARKTLAR